PYDDVAAFPIHAASVGVLRPPRRGDRLDAYRFDHPIEADQRVDQTVLASSHGLETAVEHDDVAGAEIGQPLATPRATVPIRKVLEIRVQMHARCDQVPRQL